MKFFRFLSLLFFTTIFSYNTNNALDFSEAFNKKIKKNNLEYEFIIPENSLDLQDFERIHLHRSFDEYPNIKSFYEEFIPCIITISNENENSYDATKDEFIKKLEREGHFEALKYNPNLKNVSCILNSSMVALFPIILISLLSRQIIDSPITEKLIQSAFLAIILITPTYLSLNKLNDLNLLPNSYQNESFQEIIKTGKVIKNNESLITVRFIKKEFVENVKNWLEEQDQTFVV